MPDDKKQKSEGKTEDTAFNVQRKTGEQELKDAKTDEATGEKETAKGAIKAGDPAHSPIKRGKNLLGQQQPQTPVLDPNHQDPVEGVEQEGRPQSSPAQDGLVKGHAGS